MSLWCSWGKGRTHVHKHKPNTSTYLNIFLIVEIVKHTACFWIYGRQRIGGETNKITIHRDAVKFLTKLVAITTNTQHTSTWKVTGLPRTGTTKHASMKRKTKQSTTYGRVQQLPQREETHDIGIRLGKTIVLFWQYTVDTINDKQCLKVSN